MKFHVLKFQSVKSTNDLAIKRIKSGKIKPAFLIAETQKKGRGQYGRRWVSYKGNIFISLYFKLRKKMSFKLITKKVYTIIKKSIEKVADVKVSIKLPNDLMVKGHKVCGILQETVVFNNEKYIIIGIGINLSKSPSILKKKISYLQRYSDNKIKKNDIYKTIKRNFEKFILK